jgi:hypothetical protein
MMNAKDVKATLLAVATFLIRPFIFLILGLIFGYGIGYTDAFRESDTLGNKVARVIYRMHPEALSAGVAQRAAVIRDTAHTRSGVTPIDSLIPPY